MAWSSRGARYCYEGYAPPVAMNAGGSNVLGRDMCSAERRSMDMHAWTIYAPNSRLSFVNPSATTVNVFGHGIFGDHCPANPRVQDTGGWSWPVDAPGSRHVFCLQTTHLSV